MDGSANRSGRTGLTIAMIALLLASSFGCSKREGGVEQGEEPKAPSSGGKPSEPRQPVSADGKGKVPIDGPEDRADVPQPTTGTYEGSQGLQDPYDEGSQANGDQEDTAEDEALIEVSMTPSVRFMDEDEYRIKFRDHETVEEVRFRFLPLRRAKPESSLTEDGGVVIDLPEKRVEIQFKRNGKECRVEIPLLRVATPKEHRAACGSEAGS